MLAAVSSKLAAVAGKLASADVAHKPQARIPDIADVSPASNGGGGGDGGGRLGTCMEGLMRRAEGGGGACAKRACRAPAPAPAPGGARRGVQAVSKADGVA